MSEPLSSASSDDVVVFHDLKISVRSRVILSFMRIFAKRMLYLMGTASPARVAKLQLRVASMQCKDSAGLPIRYDIVGRQPGHVIGNFNDTQRKVLLWLHGGAFSLPAAPEMHLAMVAHFCRQCDTDAFLPDYRLAPANPFPAGLNDCEQSYRDLLQLGYAPENIVVGGDSAGGTLLLGLLQRIRKDNLPMPVCAIAVSPVAEMGRVHSPPSRYRIQKRDPLLPVTALHKMCADYIGSHDSADPEVSPLYMDCTGLPPIQFTASSNEILMDDSVLLARRARQAGVDASCHIWPLLPHAVPLFFSLFPEARKAQDEIVAFIKKHLSQSA